MNATLATNDAAMESTPKATVKDSAPPADNARTAAAITRGRSTAIIVSALLAAFCFAGCGTTIGFTYEHPGYGSSTVIVRLPDRRGLTKGE